MERIGRRELVIGGISSDMCVALTALDAIAAGYDVYLVTDATGSQTRYGEASGTLRLARAGAVPVTWVALAAGTAPR